MNAHYLIRKFIWTRNISAFRTDTEISRAAQPKRERELQAWRPDTSDAVPQANAASNGTQGRGDEVTFGPEAGNARVWDQFAANERLFGVTTQFDENVYTTKLDRTGKDFKEREKRAERIAAEITGVCPALLLFPNVLI